MRGFVCVWNFRLEGLDALAKKIMSKCDGHEASLTKLEKKVQQFAEGSTMMAPQEASKLASELQQEIEVSNTHAHVPIYSYLYTYTCSCVG